MPIKGTEQTCTPRREIFWMEDNRYSFAVVRQESVYPSQGVVTAIFISHPETKSNRAQENSSQDALYCDWCSGTKAQRTFPLRNWYTILFTKTSKYAKKFACYLLEFWEKFLLTPAAFCVTLAPSVLNDRNLPNSNSLIRFDYGYRDQSYTSNHLLGLMRKCTFSYSKQVSPACTSLDVSHTTFLSWLYFINTISVIPMWVQIFRRP